MKELKDHLSYIMTINQLFLHSNNNRSMTKPKHIDIKFLVEHIGTKYIITDPLTKGLPPKVFHEHIVPIGVVTINDM